MAKLVSEMPAAAFSWISSRGARTALPPVLGFGIAVGLLFTGGVGWRTSGQWWNGLDSGSRVLLAVIAALALFVVTTVVMLLVPALTRVYEGGWGNSWPGRTLREMAIRHQVRLMARLQASKGENAYMRRYYLFPPSER